jgi:hypothetical protein
VSLRGLPLKTHIRRGSPVNLDRSELAPRLVPRSTRSGPAWQLLLPTSDLVSTLRARPWRTAMAAARPPSNLVHVNGDGELERILGEKKDTLVV